MNLYDHAKLKEAFDVYVREQDAQLPDEETLSSVTLSLAFRQRMKQLFTCRKRGFFVLFGTVGRRIATIVVALLVAVTITTASVEALRESVWAFFTQVFEKFTQVTFVDETPEIPDESVEDVFVAKMPTYIPEGYELEKELMSNTFYRITYTNKENQRIVYIQQVKFVGALTADTEGIQYTNVKVNDCEGITYTNKGLAAISFSDNEYVYKVSAPLDVEEIIKIANL